MDSPGTFPDNSIIVADNFGQIPQMQCISGSNTPNVGQWVAPNGQDLTNMASDKFDVTVGGSDDPGYVEIAVSSSQVLTLTDQGVYTCSIPDETGVNIPLHVGIYLEAYIGELTTITFVNVIKRLHVLALPKPFHILEGKKRLERLEMRLYMCSIGPSNCRKEYDCLQLCNILFPSL